MTICSDRFPVPEPVGTSRNQYWFPVPAYREPEPEPVAGTGQKPEPVILVSSRDQHPAPKVAGALKLAGTATTHGWSVRTTYALAEVPDRYFDNGNLAKSAHRLASVVVRLARGPERGWATWLSEGDGPFRFDHAFIALTRYSLRGGARPSIVERIMS